MLPGMSDLAAVAALIAEPRRAAMLDLLLDGGVRPAGELARLAGVAPSTASGHLALLLRGGLVACVIDGRERRYRLASPTVADALEALARVAPPTPVRSLRDAERGKAIRNARTCYDHLAGRLGVGLADALAARNVLVLRDDSYELTGDGEELLTDLGVDVTRARRQRRSFARSASTGARDGRTSRARSARRSPTRCWRLAGCVDGRAIAPCCSRPRDARALAGSASRSTASRRCSTT